MALGLTLAAAFGSSCYLSSDGEWFWWAGDDPELLDADAGCFRARLDVSPLLVDTWYFQADVYDVDGPGDIDLVAAYVYDMWWGDRVGTFYLDPTARSWSWYAEWPEAAAGLDCYYDDYEIDFVVTDTWGGWDSLTIVPHTW